MNNVLVLKKMMFLGHKSVIIDLLENAKNELNKIIVVTDLIVTLLNAFNRSKVAEQRRNQAEMFAMIEEKCDKARQQQQLYNRLQTSTNKMPPIIINVTFPFLF